MCAISIFIYYDWETDHPRTPTFLVVCFSAPVYSRYIRKYFWKLLGCINRSACMLWMFLLIILLTLIHQYGKFPWPSLNRKHYGVLWLPYAHYIFTLHFVTSCYTMLHTFYTWYIMNILNQATCYIGTIINDYKQRETLLSVGAHFSINEWVEFLRRHLLDHLRVKHHHTWALAHIEPGKVSPGAHKGGHCQCNYKQLCLLCLHVQSWKAAPVVLYTIDVTRFSRSFAEGTYSQNCCLHWQVNCCLCHIQHMYCTHPHTRPYSL